MSSKRQCGDCQLCCKLLPMPEFDKPGGIRCQHQRHGIGCNIYQKRPACCRVWNCRWLAGDDTGPRPDRAHYVVDIMPDYVRALPNDGGAATSITVIQVWVDPRFPDAHRNPALRAFLEAEAMPALIRFSERDAMMVAPPSANADGRWFEGYRQMASDKTHTLAEKLEHIGPMTFTIVDLE